MVIMNDLELPMLSYYVIYYEKCRRSHAANTEGSFKSWLPTYSNLNEKLHGVGPFMDH